MSWYRIYRPQTIANLQIRPVREALQRILQSGEFSHAYLLTGPKGTGKTSAARILAKVLNCEKNRATIQAGLQISDISRQKGTDSRKLKAESLQEPCNTCTSCVSITNGSSLSVTEIDAASNRGIDDIRLLREKIGLAPPDGIISVFIIDEVHMLTTEAFNALLKVLEEPPKHVVFILATTDMQKLPATVLSRCTLISYRKATVAELSDQLEAIATTEQISVDRSILETIAISADGSFRDAVKLFEQLATGKKELSESDLNTVVGIGVSRLSADLLTALLRKDSAQVAEIFSTVRERGLDGITFEREVLTLGHSKLVEFARANDPRLQILVSLLRQIAEPIDTNLPTVWLPFELACMEYALGNANGKNQNTEGEEGTSQEKLARDDRSKTVELGRDPRQKTTETDKELKGQKSEGKNQMQGREAKRQEAMESKERDSIQKVKESERIEPADDAPVGIAYEQIHQRWQEVLNKVKAKSVPVEGLLKSTRLVSLEGRSIILEASYQFHKDQLEQSKNMIVLEEVLSETLGVPLRFQVRIAKVKIQVIPNSGDVTHAPNESLVDVAQEAFL